MSGHAFVTVAPMEANQRAAVAHMLATSGCTGQMPRLGLQATRLGPGRAPGTVAFEKDTTGGG